MNGDDRAVWVVQWGSVRFYLDARLFVLCIAILAFGYVMVCSAALHRTGDIFYYPRQQLIHLMIAALASAAVAATPVSLWGRLDRLAFLGALLLLVLVLIIGKNVNGATRWISVAGFQIQVSELAKLASILYVAGYVSRREETLRNSAFGLMTPMLALGPVCLLLMLEPDFGAMVVIVATMLVQLFMAGARLLQFVLASGAFLGMGILLVLLEPYRMKRILAFLDPWADPLGKGYQPVQALIAFGRGEWTGVGLGASVQKLYYLPEAHTDYLFSVIAEELGLVGSSLVILLYAALVWRIFRVGLVAEAVGRRSAAFIAYGVGIWFGLQSFINMGVNMNLLPPKGLTLPLMSYGGGSLVVMCVALALVFRISSETYASKDKRYREKAAWANAS